MVILLGIGFQFLTLLIAISQLFNCDIQVKTCSDIFLLLHDLVQRADRLLQVWYEEMRHVPSKPLQISFSSLLSMVDGLLQGILSLDDIQIVGLLILLLDFNVVLLQDVIEVTHKLDSRFNFV